jgi:hypothetical protein
MILSARARIDGGIVRPSTFAVRGIGPNTLANYASFTRNHLLPFFGDRPLNDISPAVVEDFIAAKLTPGGSTRFAEKAIGRGSLRIGLVALRLIFQRGVQAGYLTTIR